MAPRISVIIATQRRPAPLALAARSVLVQAHIEPAEIELVVVDNDQTDSARAAVEALKTQAPFAVVYVHEPAAGVANARNAAMAAAKGRFIAFLDDDEEAPPSWLSELDRVRQVTAADVVFGPVHGRAPAGIVRHRAYLETFFSRLDPSPEGVIARYYGCGNSMLDRESLPDPAQPFSAERNQIGGEDDMLFGQMNARGARFAWAPTAWVWEDPALERLTLAYTLRRAFAYGQGASARCAAQVPSDWRGVSRWMVIGLGQAVVFGALAVAKWIVGGAGRAAALDRAARGLGKVFWGKPFHIHFYGRARPAGASG